MYLLELKCKIVSCSTTLRLLVAAQYGWPEWYDKVSESTVNPDGEAARVLLLIGEVSNDRADSRSQR